MTTEARLDQAKRLIVRGDFDRARAVLEEPPAPAMSEPGVALMWGRVLRWQHRFAESAEAFRKAAAAAPQAVEPRLLLAESLLNLRKVKDVLATLERAKRDCAPPAEGDVPGWLERYRLLVCGLDYARAAEAGERVLRLTRRSEHLEMLTWPIFTEEFDLTPRPPSYVATALENLDALLDAKPDDPWLLYFRGLMGDYDPSRRRQARADLEKLSAFPAARYGWMRLKLAQFLYNEKNFAAAAAEYSAAAGASEPGQWKALVMAAECFLRLGNTEGCLRIARSLDLLAPPRQARHSDFGECWANKGRLLLWLGLYKEALAALETAETHTCYDVPCWKGAVLAMLGRDDEAMTSLDRALTFSFTPSLDEARLWRAELLLRRGRAKEALAECGPVAESNFSWHAWLLRALARGAAGDAAGMREDYERIPAGIKARIGKPARNPGQKRISADLKALLKASGGVRADFLPPAAS